MPGHTSDPTPRSNSLAISPEGPGGNSPRPQSIREYLDACPVKTGHGTVIELCEQHGISLDSPWPPRFPDSRDSRTPESVRQNGFEMPLDGLPVMSGKQARTYEERRRTELTVQPEEQLSADGPRPRTAGPEAAKRLESVEYQHSLLCALTLPRSRQASREYVREGQGRILKISAGDLFNGKSLVPQPLPYGPKARIALMHICSEAVRTQSRFLEIERSARAFMERIGLHDGGSQYRLFRQQMNALAACHLTLGYTKANGKFGTLTAKPIEDFEAWYSNDGGTPALWASELRLGEPFFLDLLEHAVPLSGNAIRALSHSAIALDYYGLFAYRLHSLDKPLTLTWEQLREQIGQEYKVTKDFKKESLPAIRATLEVYPSAKVEQVTGGLVLKPSLPPIARQSVAVSRGLADKVKASLPPPQPERSSYQCRLNPRTIETFRKRYPRIDPYDLATFLWTPGFSSGHSPLEFPG
jgi:hypothetical protein